MNHERKIVILQTEKDFSGTKIAAETTFTYELRDDSPESMAALGRSAVEDAVEVLRIFSIQKSFFWMLTTSFVGARKIVLTSAPQDVLGGGKFMTTLETFTEEEAKEIIKALRRRGANC